MVSRVGYVTLSAGQRGMHTTASLVSIACYDELQTPGMVSP